MGEKKPMSKNMKIVMVIMIAGGIIQSAVNIGLTSTAYYSLAGTITATTDIIDSWQQYTFTSIKGDTSCTSDFKIAYNYTWPGIDQGCWCDPSDVSSSDKSKYNVTCNDFCSGSCSSDEIKAGCQDVPGIASGTFEKYVMDVSTSGSETYNYLCLQRTSERYPDTVLPSSDGCPSDYKTCGGPTLRNTYCTKQSTCPINKLTVSSTPCGSNTQCAQIFKSGSTNDYLYWDNTADALPISEIRLNEGGMCTDEDIDTISAGRSDYYLYAGDKRTSVCAVYSPRWEKLDQIDEKNLLMSAGRWTSVNNLSTKTGTYYTGSFSDASLINWNLYYRSYVEWDYNCTIMFKPLFNSGDDYGQLQTSELALFIVSIISGVFIGLILPAMLIMNLCGKDLPCIKGEGDAEYNRIKMIKRIVNYGFKIALQLPFQIWALVVIARNMAFFKFVGANQCSSALVNADLASLETQITKSYNSNISSISILSATLLLDFFLQWWHERSEKKKKAKQVQDDSNKPKTVSENMPNSNIQPTQNTTPQQQNTYQPQPQPNYNPQFQPQGQPQGQPQNNIVITINPSQLQGGVQGGFPQQQGGFPQQQGGFQAQGGVQQGGFPQQNTGNPFA